MIKYDKYNKKIQNLTKERDEATSKAKQLKGEYDKLYNILGGIMHDVRRLNAELENSCEDISKSVQKKDYNKASSSADYAFYRSGLISSRLTFAEYELNPSSLDRQPRYNAGVYKKFDKARRTLIQSANRKNIDINIDGPSKNEINALEAFELVPFVLLDNAIKYSPKDQSISIKVQDNPTNNYRVNAIITSMGPMVTENEIPQLINRGFRGSLARSSKIQGDGIGLYLANILVQLSNGSLEIRSSPIMCTISGIAYSEFIVEVKFR